MKTKKQKRLEAYYKQEVLIDFLTKLGIIKYEELLVAAPIGTLMPVI